ncbi:hypothetical protein C2S53_013963 [Perilla frutescens var. hirtella]|uniref:Uncharacterized protein n=1 Tax=Perilla frutescens var. hirtella TaxID=608512 RepID=A0AAD4PF89_PERFH|nr:hypothetical protein C2S53_013963 [Perilla frutescens var. hirtella]
MGNCLVLQENVLRATKTDCEILEYKSHIMKVDQIMSKRSHATSDELQVEKHMHPNAQVLQNHLHYLLPQPEPPRPIKTTKKAVRFSDYNVLEGGDQESGVVRIKLVISKKELQEMLSKGEVSVDGKALKMQNQEITNKAESNDRGDGVITKGWCPALESIPEIN